MQTQFELFALLKTVLKARGVTYATLAERLNLSEPTIKRIFAERDCKLSRLTEICSALDLTLDDLVTEANRVEVRPAQLGDRLEAKLADDRPVFHLFLLLLDGMSAKAIACHYGLGEAEIFAIARRLERLGLAEVLPQNRIKLTVQGPVHFRRDGPLHQKLLQLNMEFLQRAYLEPDSDHAAFLTQTRRMTQKTARHILARLREVQRDVSDLARKDQLTQPETALHSYKLGIALSPIAFPELLRLDDG